MPMFLRVTFKRLHELGTVSLSAVSVVHPKCIDVHRFPPEVTLNAPDDVFIFVADVTGYGMRTFITGLVAIESANAFQNHAEIFSLGMFVYFESQLAHFPSSSGCTL